jgi:hypothetical protein
MDFSGVERTFVCADCRACLLARGLLHSVCGYWCKTYIGEVPMPSKQILFRSDAREVILRGASALADAVRVTLGPKSKCVLIDKSFGRPLVCKRRRNDRQRDGIEEPR